MKAAAESHARINFNHKIIGFRVIGLPGGFDDKVLTGMEEADKIVSVPRDRMDKPLEAQKIAAIRVDTKGEFYPFDQL